MVLSDILWIYIRKRAKSLSVLSPIVQWRRTLILQLNHFMFACQIKTQNDISIFHLFAKKDF